MSSLAGQPSVIQVENEITPRGAAASRGAAGTSGRIRYVFRCEANVKRGPVLRYRDGIDFARKAIVESLQIDPRLVAERLA
jgi:hypothetical protein